MKSQEKTSRLEDALTNVRTSQQREQFLKQYTEDGYDRFADYLNEYMAEHDIDLAELLCRSNISRNYVYNIINGDRNPGREKIIALCIGAGMNCSEINRALKIAQEGILYAKNERDARLMIAVNQGNATVTEINLMPVAYTHLGFEMCFCRRCEKGSRESWESNRFPEEKR